MLYWSLFGTNEAHYFHFSVKALLYYTLICVHLQVSHMKIKSTWYAAFVLFGVVRCSMVIGWEYNSHFLHAFFGPVYSLHRYCVGLCLVPMKPIILIAT